MSEHAELFKYNKAMNSGLDGLLRTKLAPPRLHTAYVPRTSLLARIDEGLARKLTLISTPAGFGKTTLLAEWVASRSSELSVLSSELAQTLQLKTPIAWVTLDAGDNDPIRF